MSKMRLKSAKKHDHRINDLDRKAIELVSRRYAFGVTDHVLSTIQGSAKDDPVARQYIPQTQELTILPEESTDPIGDYAHTPVKGIVHRHQNRVLFKLANVCAVYCRFCFRREMVGPGGDVLTLAEREGALEYIRQHEDIHEVIFTGGDPLVLSPRHLENVLRELSTMDHVKLLRFHTRIPVADPKRITKPLLQLLASQKKPVYICVHVNHAQELTPEVKDTLQSLNAAGCHLLSQSVLLKGVNDHADTLAELYEALVQIHVKPYYLHHPDLAPGTSHFRVSIKEGQAIMKELQGKLSGLCLPHYMLDIPGGFGKVPIGYTQIEELEDGSHLIEDRKGVMHKYPPAGKKQA